MTFRWIAATFAAMTMIAAAAAPTVTIDSGTLAGEDSDGMALFKGIPYAAPPVGPLRWKAPQAVTPWKGTRPATAFGPVCPQTSSIKAPQSEDCLTLNVSAPLQKGAQPYPVLVWIHGGGFNQGSGSDWGLYGKPIVAKGMILVTINYRLGVFGFFAHPELSAESSDHASGNQAIRDQIAALAWVKRNIAAFGGDPGRVTIAGCSAGGSSVAALTVSPLAAGLFHRGISESGVTGPMPSQPEAEQSGAALGTTIKAPHLSDLRQLSTDELVRQNWRAMLNRDSTVFPEQPPESFAAGHQNKVPVLLGWNADEGIEITPVLFGTKDVTAAIYDAGMKMMFGPQIPPVIAARYPGKTDTEAKASAIQFTTDMIGLQHYGWAEMQRKAKVAPAYLYYFVHSPAEPPKDHPCTYGCKAGHGAEIRFAFDQLAVEPRDWSADDRALASRMLGYWINFAKTGDPNGEGLPQWTAFDGTPDSVQRLGSKAEVKERGTFIDFRPYLFMMQQ